MEGPAWHERLCSAMAGSANRRFQPIGTCRQRALACCGWW